MPGGYIFAAHCNLFAFRRSLVIALVLDGIPVLALDIVIVLSGPA